MNVGYGKQKKQLALYVTKQEGNVLWVENGRLVSTLIGRQLTGSYDTSQTRLLTLLKCNDEVSTMILEL